MLSPNEQSHDRTPRHQTPPSASAPSAPIKKRVFVFPPDAENDSEHTANPKNSGLPLFNARPTPYSGGQSSNNMMVDHNYTDYSIIEEESLIELEEEEDEAAGIAEGRLSEKTPKTTKRDPLPEDGDDLELHRERAEKLERLRSLFGRHGPTRKNSGGVVQPFPEKLMEVLERGDMEDIVTWMPHGRAFIVKNPKGFVVEVLPRFFKQSKFMSFTRQLNLWGFKRITKGPDQGSYYHELFLRGKSRLATRMRRQKIKGTGIKLTPNPDKEPNFYEMSEKRPLPPSSKKTFKPLPPLPSAGSPDQESKPSGRRLEQSLNVSGGSGSGLFGGVNGLVNHASLANLQNRPISSGLLGGQNNALNAALSQQTASWLLEAQLRNEQKMMQQQQQQQKQQQDAIANAHNLLQQMPAAVAQQNMFGSTNSAADLQQRLLAAARALEPQASANQSLLSRSRDAQILGSNQNPSLLAAASLGGNSLGNQAAFGGNDSLLKLALQQEVLKRASRQLPY